MCCELCLLLVSVVDKQTLKEKHTIDLHLNLQTHAI